MACSLSARTQQAGRPHAVPPRAANSDLVDINTATLEQLKSLPGMGRAYAQRILSGRPYTAKNQLVTRGILPQDAYERVQAFIVARHPKN